MNINNFDPIDSHVHLIVSSKNSYFLRLIYVYLKTLFFFKKTDIVFIGFAPQLIVPLLKWRFAKKYLIIDFFISLYDTFVLDRKKFTAQSSIGKLLKYGDKLTLKKADTVITDTLEHANYFVNQLDCDKAKTLTLYLEADQNYYYPKLVKKTKQLENKFVVLYFGSVLPLQGTEVILDAINQCQNENIFFIVIGPLDDHMNTNPNTRFINWLEQEQLSEYIALSDLCLAGHFNGSIDKAKRTIPGKAYIYEAMNKPMIVGDNAANKERYPHHYALVHFSEMGNAKKLKEKIEFCYQEWLK